mgnify:FL=1|jgi:hypothetical protein|tara:strand:+ start:352 stop:1014 length:663 start_codon:yes stop_codon:yes gene_type:complete
MAALWWAVILSGAYHGLNPGMGWPLAVSAALMERKAAAMPKALLLLTTGHLLAMIAILLPFSLMIWLVEREYEIRLIASFIVIGMGIYLLINSKHPRYLARIHPAKLGLWSFLSAIAHGAALMLVPIYLGICQIAEDNGSTENAGHLAAQNLMSNDLFTALGVSLVHTVSMGIAGALLAILVYFWLGLKFISQAWFNLDKIWACSLILVGAFGLYFTGTH